MNIYSIFLLKRLPAELPPATQQNALKNLTSPIIYAYCK